MHAMSFCVSIHKKVTAYLMFKIGIEYFGILFLNALGLRTIIPYSLVFAKRRSNC